MTKQLCIHFKSGLTTKKISKLCQFVLFLNWSEEDIWPSSDASCVLFWDLFHAFNAFLTDADILNTHIYKGLPALTMDHEVG